MGGALCRDRWLAIAGTGHDRNPTRTGIYDLAHLQHLITTDLDAGIRTRAARAQQVLQTLDGVQSEGQNVLLNVENDWRLTLEKLYHRKFQERRVTLPEGDPRRYQNLAVSLTGTVKLL